MAAKVLSEHLSLFIDLSENAKTAEVMVEKEDDEKEKVLEMSIDELELSVRSYNCLKRAGINTVEELTNKTSEDSDEDFSLLSVLDSGVDVSGQVLGQSVRDEIIAVLPDYTDSKLEGDSPILGKCSFTLRNIALHLEQGYGPQEIAEFFYNPSSGRHTTPSNVHKMIKMIRQICTDYGYTLGSQTC